jgi:hypothetical protein
LIDFFRREARLCGAGDVLDYLNHRLACESRSFALLHIAAHVCAQQVIKQIWITSRLGVISKRILAADESFGSIKTIFAAALPAVKRDQG